MVYACFCAAVLVLLFAAKAAVNNRNNASKWIFYISVGVFFSTFFMVLPTQWVKEGKTVYCEPAYNIVSALLYSLKSLGGRQDLAQLESIPLTGWLKAVYFGLNYIGFILAPVLASSLLVSFVGDAGERMRYWLSNTPEYYVFSELNENAISLAKGIQSKPGKKTLVFCKGKNADKEQIAKARELGAIVLYKSCEELKLYHHNARYEFYLIAENEDRNIQLAEDMIAKKDALAQSCVTVNVFAQSGANVNLLESLTAKTPCAVFESPALEERIRKLLNETVHMEVVVCNAQEGNRDFAVFAREKGITLIDGSWQNAKLDPAFATRDITLYWFNTVKNKVQTRGLQYANGWLTDRWKDDALRIRFVDEIALFCNQLIFENPLYDLPEGRKDISVLLVGGGRLGVRMLKTAVWYGQIDGYTLKIRVLDKNASKIQKELFAQCPELARYDIAFADVDVQSADFQAKVLENADATFVCVATGSDELNISVAETLYGIFRRRYSGFIPPIFTRVRQSVTSGNFDRQGTYLSERNIRVFGTAESVFADNTLFNTRLEHLAFAVHLCYNWALDAAKDSFVYQKARNDFYTSEYSRRSSMAVALHIAAKLHSCGIGEDDLAGFAELMQDAAVAERMARNEHERWNAFVRSEGFRTTDFETVKKYAPHTRTHKDEAAKLHPCILPWEELDHFQEEYNKLQAELLLKPSDFKEYDFKIVREIPQILEKAKQLCQEGI